MDSQRTRSLSSDEVVFLEGEIGDCAYLIERGRVLVYVTKDEAEVALRTLGEGEVIGEMSLIDSFPRSASCRALCDTKLMVVTKEQLLERVQAADPVVRLLMRALLERLRAQNAAARGGALPSDPSRGLLESEKREVLKRIELENRLQNGLAENEFTPHYQPIYDVHTGDMAGCEALIRWFPKTGEVIPPSLFMDVIEQSSLARAVGQMVIEKCLNDLGQMLERFEDTPDFFVSINVSGRQFADPNFVQHLEATRIAHGLSTHNIKLELTERVMMEGPEGVATLKACRDLGYLLAIDDFGTGFSSLQYLASMPLTDLKIDRSFVMNMLKDEKSLAIVKSLIYMADLLDLNLIAEGIETIEELALIKSLGVEMGQGFLFSKGVPLADLLRLPLTVAA